MSEPAAPFPIAAEPRLRIVIPLIVGCAFFMEGLDSTMIAVALPAMARSLGETPLRLSLVITAYLLSLAVFIPVSGWIADRFGARRVFCAAVLIFAAGSALCGLADNLPMLVAMRVVQGFGGAMMTPVGRLVLLRSFPRAALVSAMNWMTIPSMIGPMVGPVIGGVLTDYASWRWIFFLNIPIGVLGGALALWFFKDFRAPSPARFDLVGFRDHRGGAVHARTGARKCRASGGADGARHRLLPDRGGDAAGLLEPRAAQPRPGARP